MVLAAAAVAAAPWWLAAVFALAAPRFGLRYAAYERIGYSRFALRDVAWQQDAARATAARLEADQLLVWLWRRWLGGPGAVHVENLRIEVARERPTERPGHGWLELRAKLGEGLTRVQPWLPEAQVRSGEVAWSGGRATFAAAEWRDRRLQVTAARWRKLNADAIVTWDAGQDRLRLDVAEKTGGAELAVTERAGAVDGTLRWQEQTAVLAGRFGEAGWLPVEASCTAVELQIPASALRLGGGYETVRGQGSVDWREGRLTVALKARGEPAPGAKAPPLEVDVRGAGDRTALNVEALTVQLPGLQAQLSEPVRIEAEGAMLAKPVRFTLEADLAAQPWWGMPAQGRITGEGRLEPREGAAWPLVIAELTLKNVTAADWTITDGDAKAQLDWPLLTVSGARLALAGGDELTLEGGWNWRERRLLTSKVNGRAGEATLARWLPNGVRADGVEFSGAAEGVWPALRHQGRLTAKTVAAAPLRPQALQITWSGEGATLPKIELQARRENHVIELAGALEAEAWRIDRLRLEPAGAEAWLLQAPVRIARRAPWSVTTFSLRGASGEISVEETLGPEGRASLRARGLNSEWLRAFLELPAVAWQVERVALGAEWRNGPATWNLDAAGRVGTGAQWTADVEVKAGGDGGGATVETLRVNEAGQPVATAQGRWPLAFWPHERPALRWTAGADWALTADAVPDSPFWENLTALTGVSLVRPKLTMNIRGAGRSVTGEAAIAIDRVALDAKRFGRAWPELSALSAQVRGDGAAVRLENLSASVAGQVVRAHGWVPVTVENWPDLRKDPALWIRNEGELLVELPSAEIAALARFVPEYLAPIGRMEAQLAFRPGREVEGMVRLQGAATRPLGAFGALQEIGAELALHGRALEVRNVSARIGGQPVRVAGRATWTEEGTPAYDLSLQGENVPLVRQAGLLVRSNLDLQLKTADARTRIRGSVTLRNSLLLADARDLLLRRGGGNARSRRAPYFSVERQPFAAWELDVAVGGSRFMRLRTPVFSGVVSAKLRLDGTLLDPRALGEVTVDEGRVTLPFASFVVQEGQVRLTQANPQEPQVMLTGTGRRLGYELRMELTGSALAPNLAFTSTPPLDSSQILLMVMAGEAPQQEVAYTGRQRVTRLGTYLGQGLLGQLGGDATQADRLSVTSGEKVSRQGRETYDVEYQLTPRWSLTGEYDEFDEYNVGVRLRFRGKEPGDEKQ
ncbi:MAG TPA: translocation/assembly module TamB domain-containing protein [Opitutaceae bacterium]